MSGPPPYLANVEPMLKLELFPRHAIPRNLLGPIVAALVGGLVILFASDARALPLLGEPPPDVELEDAWDRRVAMAKLGAKPVLVVYEDEASAKQNKELKADLAELAKGGQYKKRVALLAVADLDGYDYWPVKGFVKDAIRDESRKQQLSILCDWNGKFRKALGLVKGSSNVVLYGKDGKVLFSHAGPLSRVQRATLISSLQSQVGSPE